MADVNPWIDTTREIHRSHLEGEYALLHKTIQLLRAGIDPLDVADHLEEIKDRAEMELFGNDQ